MRAQWLHDMRTALEKNGIGWAMWDCRTEFALVNKANGLTTGRTTIAVIGSLDQVAKVASRIEQMSNVKLRPETDEAMWIQPAERIDVLTVPPVSSRCERRGLGCNWF
jgi:hypothetical protein